MGILVVILLVLSAILLLLSRRTTETILIALLDLSLAEFWYIMLIYIAKKGGFGNEIQTLLFGSREIRVYLQYLIFTLGQLGYVMAIGRYLFPLFLMWLAFYYSKRINGRTLRSLFPVAAILPLVSLIIYYPGVFEWIISLNSKLTQILVWFSLIWIVLYLAVALGLLLLELHDMTMRFYKHRMAKRVAMACSLVILYALYCPQDPAQVYLFYRNEYMGAQHGLWYLSSVLNISTYVLVFALVIICTSIGVYSMIRYAWENIQEGQQENAIHRKFDATSKGASVFVHSVKNQLLANRVLIGRMETELNKEKPNLETLKNYHQQLAQNNGFMINRMEELYRSIRTNSITLVEESVREVCELAVSKLQKKYPDAKVDTDIPKRYIVLCDKNHLTEALYNLLINGWEAQISKKTTRFPLLLQVKEERSWIVFNVTDHGGGLTKEQQKHMFEPFWSSKNSNYNWGMGLYYVRVIVKSHFGVLRVEVAPENGTTFVVQLPRYQSRNLK